MEELGLTRRSKLPHPHKSIWTLFETTVRQIPHPLNTPEHKGFVPLLGEAIYANGVMDQSVKVSLPVRISAG